MQIKSLKPTARLIFATNLKRLRLERALSQELLAEMANLHRTYVGSVELTFSATLGSKMLKQVQHDEVGEVK